MTKKNNIIKTRSPSEKEKESKIPLVNIQTLILVFLFSIFLANHLLARDKITKSQLGIENWPLSTKNHLQMAETYFNIGYENEAHEEFKKAEALYSSLSFLDIPGHAKNQLEKTKALLSHPEKIRQDINYWETVLKSKPHYRDVFLRLSLLNYELYQEKKAQEYWEKAFYLDPNNEKIQEIRQTLGVISNQ